MDRAADHNHWQTQLNDHERQAGARHNRRCGGLGVDELSIQPDGRLMRVAHFQLQLTGGPIQYLRPYLYSIVNLLSLRCRLC